WAASGPRSCAASACSSVGRTRRTAGTSRRPWQASCSRCRPSPPRGQRWTARAGAGRFPPMSAHAGEFTAHDVLGRLKSLAGSSPNGPGVPRFAYDDAWCDAHRWLAREADSLGWAATADWAGNLFFHDPAVAPGDAVLLVGSHLDSVVHGGH